MALRHRRNLFGRALRDQLAAAHAASGAATEDMLGVFSDLRALPTRR